VAFLIELPGAITTFIGSSGGSRKSMTTFIGSIEGSSKVITTIIGSIGGSIGRF
jgi:hypothetical protein